jgi:hypothetical protein
MRYKMDIREGIKTFDPNSVRILTQLAGQMPQPQQIVKGLLTLNPDERLGLIKILNAAGYKQFEPMIADKNVNDNELVQLTSQIQLDEVFGRVIGMGNMEIMSILAYLMNKAGFPQIAKVLTVGMHEVVRAGKRLGKDGTRNMMQNALNPMANPGFTLNNTGGI